MNELYYNALFVKALQQLVPGASFNTVGDIEWVEEKTPNGDGTGVYTTPSIIWLDEREFPSKESIDLEIVKIKQEFEYSEYQRKRQPEYPPLADLADALYWQAQGDESKMTAYLAAVEAVKQKYPKGV